MHMNTSGIIRAAAKGSTTIISFSVIYQRNYIGSSNIKSTNFEPFKAQIGKLLTKHIVLTLRAANIILLYRRPSVRIMSSGVRIIHIIHCMHTLAYICCKILTFHDKVYETYQGCMNTLLLTFKISVCKLQESRSIRRSEARKLRCVKVHLLFNRNLYCISQ